MSQVSVSSARRTPHAKRAHRVRKVRALAAVSSLAGAGALVLNPCAAFGDVSHHGFTYSPGLTLQAGSTLTVTKPAGNPATTVFEDGANGANASLALFDSGSTKATGTVSLFAGEGSDGTRQDCAGESEALGSSTHPVKVTKGCSLYVTHLVGGSYPQDDLVNITVAFPNVSQSLTTPGGTPLRLVGQGTSVMLSTDAQVDPVVGTGDEVQLEECSPISSGFDQNKCVSIATMSGTSGAYVGTGPVSTRVGSTACKGGHSVAGAQPCSLWTVEVHHDSSGTYWWPLSSPTAALQFK